MSTNVDEANPSSSATRDTISAIAGWLGIILLVATVVYFAVTGNFDLTDRVLLIAAFLALTAYVWLNPETIAAVITGKGTRNLLTTVIMVLLGIAIVVALNWLYGLAASRVGEFGRLDLTAGQSLTLSAQSQNAAKEQPGPVKAVGFFRQDDTGVSQQREADNLLKEYTKYNPNITVQWVDPDVDPFTANNYGLTRVNTVVFDNGQHHETADSINETAFTGALLRLLSNEKKTVAVLNVPSLISFSGSSSNAASASVAQSGLTAENYTVLSPINVVVSPTISVSDVTVLIVPPTATDRPLNDAETNLITDYLDKGGHVLLMGDPLGAPMPASILAKYGITETRSLVVEQNPGNVWGNSPLNIVIFNYPSSTVTRDMENVPTIFRTAGIIQPPAVAITGFSSSTILQSSSDALGARLAQDANTQQATLEQDPNIAAGAQPIALTVEQILPEAESTTTDTAKPNATRLIVVDDYDWVTDELMSQPVGNRDLFNNMINWLSESEERISVRPADTTDRSIFLTNEQKNLIAWSTIIFLPLLALAGGAVVWWRRR